MSPTHLLQLLAELVEHKLGLGLLPEHPHLVHVHQEVVVLGEAAEDLCGGAGNQGLPLGGQGLQDGGLRGLGGLGERDQVMK